MNGPALPSGVLSRHGPRRPMVIGLVNNASDLGLKSTERQFCDLLRAAAPGVDLQIRLYTCPGVGRSDRLRDPRGLYADVRELPGSELDALIVTGMEPQAASLSDEPVWSSLIHVADWAEENAVPTIWSCLAAHAAVLHRAGIPRTRLAEKLSGVFGCAPAPGEHPLTRGLPPRWYYPHSRYHGLAEDLLTNKGYQIVSRSEVAGADIFLQQRNALFIFFQGHPEYEAGSLLSEYKRDIRRYVAGERNEFPASPRNYFDAATDAALAQLRERAVLQGKTPKLSDVLGILNGAACTALWRPTAARLMSNFLAWVVRDAETCSSTPEMADGAWQGSGP